jgi:hypothetical protein
MSEDAPPATKDSTPSTEQPDPTSTLGKRSAVPSRGPSPPFKKALFASEDDAVQFCEINHIKDSKYDKDTGELVWPTYDMPESLMHGRASLEIGAQLRDYGLRHHHNRPYGVGGGSATTNIGGWDLSPDASFDRLDPAPANHYTRALVVEVAADQPLDTQDNRLGARNKVQELWFLEHEGEEQQQEHAAPHDVRVGVVIKLNYLGMTASPTRMDVYVMRRGHPNTFDQVVLHVERDGGDTLPEPDDAAWFFTIPATWLGLPGNYDDLVLDLKEVWNATQREVNHVP